MSTKAETDPTALALAADLVTYATGLLVMSARLRGEVPGMPLRAEFQSLDMIMATLRARIMTYKAVLETRE